MLSDVVAGNEILPSNQVDLCAASTYGCCRDGVTAAGGPGYRGCDDPCQVGAVWVLCGCYMGVVWVLYGCCMGIVWLLPGRRHCGRGGGAGLPGL